MLCCASVYQGFPIESLHGEIRFYAYAFAYGGPTHVYGRMGRALNNSIGAILFTHTDTYKRRHSVKLCLHMSQEVVRNLVRDPYCVMRDPR